MFPLRSCLCPPPPHHPLPLPLLLQQWLYSLFSLQLPRLQLTTLISSTLSKLSLPPPHPLTAPTCPHHHHQLKRQLLPARVNWQLMLPPSTTSPPPKALQPQILWLLLPQPPPLRPPKRAPLPLRLPLTLMSSCRRFGHMTASALVLLDIRSRQLCHGRLLKRLSRGSTTQQWQRKCQWHRPRRQPKNQPREWISLCHPSPITCCPAVPLHPFSPT